MESATTESSLLSKLQSPDLSNIRHLFSAFLSPFAAVLQNPPKKPPSRKPITASSKTLSDVRSLAKQFLPFLNRTLSLLPRRLSETPKIDPQFAVELFEIYKLCLDCLDAVSSQLSCKPYSVQIQRVRLIHCYETWEQYADAESEGILVLQSLRSIGKSGRIGNKYVPELGKQISDPEFACLLVEIVVTLVKCVSSSQSTDENDYKRVLVMVEEITPWFRVLDANAYEKLHRVLVTYMSRCALLLVGDLMHFDEKLVTAFSLATLELAKSSSKDQMHKFARRICYSIFSQQESHSTIIGILAHLLDFLGSECKVNAETNTVELLELICYCANKCRTATSNICFTVAEHFNKLADLVSASPTDLIIRLYAMGLLIIDFCGQLKLHDSTTLGTTQDSSVFWFLINDNILLELAGILELLKHHYNCSLLSKNLPCSAECCTSVNRMRLCAESDNEPSICMQSGKPDLLSYCTALQFLCQPLTHLINSEKKEIITEIGDVTCATNMYCIQDAFHHFLDVVLVCKSASERGRDACDDNNKTLLSVAVAAFTLSFRTKQKIKESVTFIKYAISSDWIQSHGLKFLFASLHNIGVVLYRNDKTKEALKALKLCCRASWTCVIYQCKILSDKSNGFYGDLSEDAIIDFLSEACAKSAFVLDVVYHCDSHKVNQFIIDCLQNWSVAEDLFDRLASPTALVKQWVKIQCKLFKDEDMEHNAKTLYSLLPLCVKMSKRALSLLFEQELLSYKEMNSLNPKLCQRMQMDIVDILLEKVYTTKTVHRSRILIAKGKKLRACGVERLDDCIKCLTESISIMSEIVVDKHGSTICSHQLAVAYCLRALCTQEAEPNSKVLLNKRSVEDIDAALKLWLSTDNPYASGQTDMVLESTLFLLYYVVDLLSLKGFLKFQADIYEMIIRLFQLKKLPIKKCLAKLWECRRLGHALCASPVNEMFIRILSQHCDASESMEFWLSCLTESQPIHVGFKQNFCFMSTYFSLGSHHHESCSLSDITIDEVKQAASDLLSSVPIPSGSAFLAAYLYYDLCERLISNGRFIEALSHAKEAHQIRSKLFQEKFMYSIEQQTELLSENGEVVQKQSYGLKTFEISSSAATAAWFCENASCDFECNFLTPWNVLQCYLESTLQVGAIHEIVGNGSDAETLFQWGKHISCSQNLPFFIVAFSSILGKLYCKQRLWDLAELELQRAAQLLKELDGWSPFCCYKCRIVLEVSIDQQLGDLSRGRCVDCNIENSYIDRILYAEKKYELAVEKLKISEWKNSASNPEESAVHSTNFSDALGKDVKHSACCSSQCEGNNSDMKEVPLECKDGNTKREPLMSRKNRKASNTHQHNLRTTRSRSHTSKRNVDSDRDEVFKSKNAHFSPDAISEQSETKHAGANAGNSMTDICDKMKCWHCLPHEVRRSGYLNNYIHMKWEVVRRRLLLRLLNKIGKCSVIQRNKQKGHDIFTESISVLVQLNLFSPTCNFVPLNCTLYFIGLDIPGDVLAIERATTLYNLSWFILKSYNGAGTSFSSDLSRTGISKITSWLKQAFILCREVPILLQKVSRLLAVLYILSAVNLLPEAIPFEALYESQWASYFHQASLGTHFNHQLFSRMAGKQKGLNSHRVEGCTSNPTSIGPETLDSIRPTSASFLTECATTFFQILPPATIICISLLGDAYASLLREFIFSATSVQAWILFSRLNSNCQPITLLLPADSILQEASDDESSSPRIVIESENFVKRWHCPWGSTVVDDVAPIFKLILEQNYLSSSIYPLEDTKKTRSIWWTQRRKLDQYLGNFLRDLEEKWFGTWKFLLLGEWSDCKHLKLVQDKMMNDLKEKCKIDVHESLLKVVLAGGKHACQSEACVSNLILNNGCYIPGVGCNLAEMLAASKIILESVHDIEKDSCVNREPIVLVLDIEVQMLPWESLPILRNQEVYRMPSVGSIFGLLDRCGQEKLGTGSRVFPSIDPLDAYYLLNPSGDLSSTEVEFHKWFTDKKLEGKTGTSPTIEELSIALKSHELFIYFGHGSGAQYIPGHEIQKLESCAATLLMGCSSGSLSLSGSYAPQGAPLCYLLAGSPVIVANLWEVTDKDIDRFGKSMLDFCLRERSTESIGCAQCSAITDELKSLNIYLAKGNGRKRSSRKKLPEACDINTCNPLCRHKPKIGSFMGQAREACTLPFLIGASPVCYGVPTGIKKKLDL